ncbi:hypothetical protein Val02_32360 [Virgisporangium aliadipatigenens]|uniref:DUF1616 domain-containing protein n=1 Tax=Virgisporangium aliadipatigenens TaxID=741659 RepID=A0A8J3YM10_9ACTN|nr:DUF1616 domain-containing protein [Virgisporangium aliadipatigenens]GIJ46350.1 hypothetical protein Val02_32360 [Virgisporangium aliadipatigenens]
MKVLPEEPGWPRSVALAAVAVVCAVLAALTDGPVRYLAGAALCLYLPGRLAVLAMFVDHASPDRYLRAVLIGPLSLVATAAAGLAVAALGRGFRPVPVCATLLAQCLLLAAVSIGRRYRDSPGAPGFWRPGVRPRWSWLAALPAVALTGVLVWQVAEAARYRSPESYYTELAAADPGTVRVRNRERTAQDYRLEVRQDGRVTETTEFRLEPDGVRLVPVPPEGAEVRLYRNGETAPYRHLRL